MTKSKDLFKDLPIHLYIDWQEWVQSDIFDGITVEESFNDFCEEHQVDLMIYRYKNRLVSLSYMTDLLVAFISLYPNTDTAQELASKFKEENDFIELDGIVQLEGASSLIEWSDLHLWEEFIK
jgi:hypothetical protein